MGLLWSKVPIDCKMENINLKNENEPSNTDIINLADVGLNKISIGQKERGNFQIDYDGKPFTIGIKPCGGTIKRGKKNL